MAEKLTVADYEVARLCGYIKNNGTIANYFGIERGRVERIRNRLKVMRYKIPNGGTMITEVPEPINDRTPCPRCGVRRDIGCAHSTARLVAA